LPALSLLAGGLFRIAPRAGLLPAAALAGLLLVPSAYASVSYDRLLGVTDTRRLAADWMLAHVPPDTNVTRPYYGGAFYDDPELLQNRYYIPDPLASGYLQGRYTDRYHINATPAGVVFKASGPPWQYPVPDG